MARTELEQLVYQMSVDIRQLNRQYDRAHGIVRNRSRGMQTDIDRMGQRMNRQFDRIAAGAPVVGSALTGMGVAGAAAGAVLLAALFAVDRALEAMTFGDKLEAQSAKLRMSAEAFQEWQFAAEEADVPLDKLAASMEALDQRLGAFHSKYGDAKVKGAFALLFGSEEEARKALANVHDANAALPIMADQINRVSSTAVQSRIAKGLGIDDLLPLLRRGSDGIAALREEARELGLVLSNETVKALADADRQMEIASRQIEASLRVAFTGLAVDIAAATSALAQFFVWLRKIESANPNFARWIKGPAVAMLDDWRKRRQSQALAADVRGLLDPRGAFNMPADMRADLDAAYGSAPPVLPGRGGGGGGKSAEQLERERRERARRLFDMFQQFEDQELRAQEELAKTAEERYELARERARLERVAFEEDLRRKVEDKDLTEAQAEEARAARDRIEILNERIAAEEKAKAIAEREAEYVRDIGELTADLLRLRSDSAKTWRERRDVEHDLLRLEQEARRAEYEAKALREQWNDAKRAEVFALLDQIEHGERAAVDRGTEGPLAQLARDLELTADKAEELAVRGLESLTDGLLEAAEGAKELEDVARDVFRQIAADLVRAFIQENITRPAANWLATAFKVAGAVFGGGGGGHAATNAPGLASGTLSSTGGLRTVGEFGKEILNVPEGAEVFPNSLVRAIESLNPGALAAARGGIEVVIVAVDKSQYFEAEVRRAAEPMVSAASQATLKAANNLLPREQSRRLSQRLGMRGR